MYDKSVPVLEQYDIEAEKIRKGRGVLLIDTKEETYRLQEYRGSVKRLIYEEKLKEEILKSGKILVDSILKNKDGELLSQDIHGDKYILTRHFCGNECDVKNRGDIIEAVKALAEIHKISEKIDFQEIEYIPEVSDCVEDMKRHNEELKRIRGYIRRKNRKTEFEYEILARYDEFYSIAEETEKKLEQSEYQMMKQKALEEIQICHGNFNYHNVIFEREGIAVIHFEHSGKGVLIRDLYFFLRKIMEKYDWNRAVGMNIIENYDRVRSLTGQEKNILLLLLTYPEKYWKILNHYYNKNKSYLPDHMKEKMKKVYVQQRAKQNFCRGLE